MAGVFRTILPCEGLRGLCGAVQSGGFNLMMQSMTVLHQRVYNVTTTALAVQHVAGVSLQLQQLLHPSTGARSYDLLDQEAAWPSSAGYHEGQARLSSTGCHEGQLGAYQAVIAAASDPNQVHSRAVTAASRQLLHLIQEIQANETVYHQQISTDEHMQQVTQQLHYHAQQAALPVDQLLALLAAVLKLQHPPTQLTQVIVDSTMHTIAQMTPEQLISTLNGLASLPGGLQGAKRSLSKAVTAYLQKQQHAFNTASTAAVAAALVRCKQYSSFTVLSMLAMDHTHRMSPQQLVQLLSAFADARHYNQAVMEAAAKSCVRLLQQQGHRLAYVDMEPHNSTISQSVVYVAQQHSTHVQSVEQSPPQQSSLLTANNLVQLLDSCARLRHHDALLLETAAIAAVRSLKHMQLQQVVQVVTTCAQLNHYSAGLFEEACRLLQQAMTEKQQPRSTAGGCHTSSDSDGTHSSTQLVSVITDLAWSCALMDHLDAPFWQQVAVWSSKLNVSSMSEHQLLCWFQVQSCLTDAAVSHNEFRTLGLGNHLLLAAQEAWLQKLQGRPLTTFHKEVHEALQETGTRCRLNVALDGPLVVDVALIWHKQLQGLQPKSRVALQLETPDMFAANSPYTALGPTAARWRALQCRGWRVVSLRYSDWRALKTAEQRTMFIWNMREALASRGPGLALSVVQPRAPVSTKNGGQQTASAIGRRLLRLFVD